MAVKWIGTKYPGVRYYEHAKRTHGLKPDRYYSIRYKVSGKSHEEGLGWSSEGYTAQSAATERAMLKRAHATGEGPQTLAEKRLLADEKRLAEQEARDNVRNDSITVKDFFENQYLPQAKANKGKSSWLREISLFNSWISPAVGEVPLKALAFKDLEAIKSKMSAAGRAPRSINYALAVIRQLFNCARTLGVCTGESPTRNVKKPVEDNRRLRFLTHTEAHNLLKALRKHSQIVYEMALLSLHCGLRAGEIFSLTWQDVDLERGFMTLRDTKSGRNRRVPLTKDSKRLFSEKVRGLPSILIFPSRDGGKGKQISDTFNRVVTGLGLNSDIIDSRYKVVFHTLRHTYASWLAEAGVDMYVLAELMGHSDLKMTSRYAHLSPKTLIEAVKALEDGMRRYDKSFKD